MPFVIGITGRLESGKTSLANFLVDALSDRGIEAQIVPFAHTMKDFALRMGWNGKKDGKGRRLLQLLGTEVGRECINEDIWIDKWTKAANRWLAGDVWVIADDLRYNNEAQRIQDMGGIIIEIERPLPRRSFIDWLIDLIWPGKKHASEAGIDGNFVSELVHNGQDLEWLEIASMFIADTIIKTKSRGIYEKS